MEHSGEQDHATCTHTHGSTRALKDALLSTKRSASLAFAMSPCADAIRKHVGAVSMEEPSACRSCFFRAFKIRTPGMVEQPSSMETSKDLFPSTGHWFSPTDAKKTCGKAVDSPNMGPLCVDTIAQHEGAQRRSTVSSSFSCSIF